MTVAADKSKFTEEAVHDVMVNIIYGGLLAVMVIFFFLADIASDDYIGDGDSNLDCGDVPVHGGTEIHPEFHDVAGAVAGCGVVDRRCHCCDREYIPALVYGKKPAVAAYDATTEIALAVLATTLTMMVVFVPVAFMKGIVGQFFYAFGMTVAVSVAVSLFVAFTLTPMLSSRWLKEEHEFHQATKNPVYRFTNWWNGIFEKLNLILQKAVGFALNRRALVVTAAVLTFVGSLTIVPMIGTEFVPEYDRGEFFVSFKTSPGTSLVATSDLSRGY